MRKFIFIYDTIKYSVFAIMTLGFILMVGTLFNVCSISFWLIVPMLVLPLILFTFLLLILFFFFLIKRLLARYYINKAHKLGLQAEKELKEIAIMLKKL